MSSHFLFNFLFLKILSFVAQKPGIFGQKMIYYAFGASNIFEKKWENVSSIYVWLVKNIPSFKNVGAKKKKIKFDDFSKVKVLAKNLTIKIDSFWNLLSKNVYIMLYIMYTFIYFTFIVFKLQQKRFSQNTTKVRGWHYP